MKTAALKTICRSVIKTVLTLGILSLPLATASNANAQNQLSRFCTPGKCDQKSRFSTSNNNHTGNNYAQDVLWIDERRSQRSAFHDCMNDRLCYEIASAVATYFGVPENAMTAFKLAAKVTTSVNGESTSFYVSPPSGYNICRVDVRTNSVVPANGNRASQMSIGASLQEIGIMTTTPRLQFSKGGSSWSGWFVTTFVKQGHNHGGRCSVGTERKILRCKGSATHGGSCGIHRL